MISNSKLESLFNIFIYILNIFYYLKLNFAKKAHLGQCIED